MKTSDFDFSLPQELIAQFPLENRSASRLMVLNRKTKTIDHKHFNDLLEYLNNGDVLVLNESRVIPARLFGFKEETLAHVELLVLSIHEKGIKAMVRNAKVVKEGSILNFGDGKLRLKCIHVEDKGIREFEMLNEGIFLEILNSLGHVPLPPYIKEQLEDPERYQTVYSKNLGSAAAPTAGLHFTQDLLKRLEDKGIEIVKITLHVGLGTFKPVDVDEIDQHVMHSETYEVSKESANRLNQAKKQNRRIIAVGTTSVRTLETQMQRYGEFKAELNDTAIFITPGYTFNAVDAMITNFHLPKSTLLMLVSAFYSREEMLKAYTSAIEHHYRFFSFGDAMFIQ